MKVYVVLIDKDFTEGSGAMKLHKIFKTKELAQEYVKDQPGIMGSAQPLNPYYRNDENERWNGYDIKTFELLESYNKK